MLYLHKYSGEMERLKQISESRLHQVKADFKRFLMDEIHWDDRMIGISGARGSGKTTLILQHMKSSLPVGAEALYVSLDDIYFARESGCALCGRVFQKGRRIPFYG